MDTDTFVGWQWGVTLLIALGLAILLWVAVQRSRRRDAVRAGRARGRDLPAGRQRDRAD